jgi:sugar lactone lactonase YvrE
MLALLTGLGLLESPRWHAGRLWAADWTVGRIFSVDPAARGPAAVQVVLEHRSLPMCFDFLPDGRLMLTSSSARTLLCRSADGTLTPYADLSALSPHAYPPFNDIVIDGRANTYVNNVNFDFAAGPPAGDPAPGFVALVTPDGQARVVADDLAFPNGMAVTADNATLVVAESHRHRLTAFDIAADGSLDNRRVWAAVGDHSPDGLCLDGDGAVWYADVADKCCVRVGEGGEVLQRVQLDRGAFACMLGEHVQGDGAALYVVAAHWPGPQRLLDHTDWDGSVLCGPAPASAAGWPASG